MLWENDFLQVTCNGIFLDYVSTFSGWYVNPLFLLLNEDMPNSEQVPIFFFTPISDKN